MTGGTTSYAIAAAVLVLLSGAVMVIAGVLAHTDGWTVAGPVTIAGGVLVLAAFVAARRARGHPSYGMTLPASVATLMSGAIMVLAGYGASAWAWWVGLLLVPLGGLVIMAAFVFELDAAEGET